VSSFAEIAPADPRYSEARARIAQLVEHFHGKEGVAGSSPAPGSLRMQPTAASLVIHEGAGAGSEHPVDGELILGREHASADLVIDDPGVSCRHARVLADPGGLIIEDLGSSNGTYVNGQDAPAGEEPQELYASTARSRSTPATSSRSAAPSLGWRAARPPPP
jgi:FHA domain